MFPQRKITWELIVTFSGPVYSLQKIVRTLLSLSSTKYDNYSVTVLSMYQNIVYVIVLIRNWSDYILTAPPLPPSLWLSDLKTIDSAIYREPSIQLLNQSVLSFQWHRHNYQLPWWMTEFLESQQFNGDKEDVFYWVKNSLKREISYLLWEIKKVLSKIILIVYSILFQRGSLDFFNFYFLHFIGLIFTC